MPEKIVISFDDDEEEPLKPFPQEISEPEKIVEEIHPLNSLPKGTKYLDCYYDSPLKYPSGIDKSFYIHKTISLKDTFTNTLLETSSHIIASSASGSIFFINKKTGNIDERFNYKEQKFEKTGVVISDEVYINSTDKIYKISNLKSEEIYFTEKGTYIWTDLNYEDKLVFLEYNPDEGKIILNVSFKKIEIASGSAPPGSVLISPYGYCIVTDKEFLLIDKKDFSRKSFPIFPSEEKYFLFNAQKIFFIQNNDEIYYYDNENKIRYSGIRNKFLNSLASFGQNIFLGNLFGWDAYTFTGNLVFSHSENSPCEILALSDNIICIGMDNDLLLHNMNKLSEAETVFIKSENGFDKVISALISRNAIYALTKNGTFAEIYNSKLNIKI